MPTTDAQGRTISDDGNWWWDGSAWQPVKKGFFDTLADSVESAVKKVEGTPVADASATPAAAVPTAAAPVPAPSAAAPTAAAPVPEAAAPAPTPASIPAPAPAYPVIPPADLLAYLGALKGSGTVTDEEYDTIRKRIPGQS